MRWQGMIGFGLGVGVALTSVGTLVAQSQVLPASTATPQAIVPSKTADAVPAPSALGRPVSFGVIMPDTVSPTASPLKAPSTSPVIVQKGEPTPQPGPQPSTQPVETKEMQGSAAIDAEQKGGGDEEPALGPTPLNKVGILNGLIYGENAKDAKILFSGWMDFDYTYRSTGSGINNVAPVMNRFGNEFLVRQLGLFITKPLDNTKLSWGFNVIYIAGADAAFLYPTQGYGTNSNPRFAQSFTDLNLTAHLPILTEGGVDVKAGRQTTILGPMGALPWQRPFTSSDYAWYNMEEGRYTGVSAVWHISKRLDWYNGIEFGAGTFFANRSVAPQYITNVSYWLDCEAKKTKVWTTLLTGPENPDSNGNTTVVEFGLQQNWNRYLWTIVDTQMVYSKAPVFGPVPPGYIERAYDIYTYNGVHLNCEWDLNTRLEWYRDVDGGGYFGGFGRPKTNYYEATVGLDYHPTKWLQVRPEIRYDYATNPNFGRNNDHRSQLSLAAELFIKF